MHNLMVVFPFSVLEWEYHFLVKSGTKSQNCQFKLKFGVIQMVRLIFSIFAQNIYIYIFEGETLRGGLGGDGGANFSKKLKLFVEAKI